MQNHLCGTILTGSHIKDILSKSPFIDFRRHQITAVQAEPLGDQGFTSSVLRVRLTWYDEESRSSIKQPESIVIKVISKGEVLDQWFKDPSTRDRVEDMKRSLVQAHTTECSVYELEELGDHVAIPRCYGFVDGTNDKYPNIILLEDLSDRGLVLPMSLARTRGMDWNQLDNLVANLASLHAWSFNTKVNWRKSIPTFLNDITSSSMNRMFLSALPKSLEQFPDVFRGVDQAKMNEFLVVENYNKLFDENPRDLYDLPVVLVHGDVHPSNILFENKADGSAGHRMIALIDWQLAHQGCGVEDLSRIFATCRLHEMKAEIREKMIEKYVQVFNEKVNEDKNHIKVENVRQALKEMCCYKSMAFACALSTMSNLPARKQAKMEKVEKQPRIF